MRPNPLDMMFLALDEAWRRCGLPGTDIHIHLEFEGRVDESGLRRALTALHRVYPATAATLARRWPWAAPNWRIDDAQADAEPLVQVESLDPPTEEELHRRLEALLSTRIDYRRASAVRIYVLRGLPRGDVVVFRWPHALTDARGGVTLIGELGRLYDENPDPDALRSSGDEQRRDFGLLEVPTTPAHALLDFLRRPQAANGTARRHQTPAFEPVRICPDALGVRDEPMRLFVRRLDPDQAARVREAAMRVCGFARMSDFLRAGIVRAVDDVAGRPRGRDVGYTSMHILDARRKRDIGPVCHNVFSTVPIHVPAAIASDRRAVADLVRDRTAEGLRSDLARRRLAGMALLGQIPFDILAAMVASARRTGRSVLPLGLSNAPSAPMGFMGPAGAPRERLFGARLVNMLGVWAASPRAGFTMHVNAALERMNVAGVYYESQMPRNRIDLLVDRFFDAITDPKV